MPEGIGWIVEAAVSGDFDSIDKTRLQEVLRKRVNEGRIKWLIGKWLRAGVMEEGVLMHPETGVPQGGTVSPVLANICLQHVLDAWFERDGRPRMQGHCFLIRFADDCVIGCAEEADARKMMAVLPKRFARFGLRMPPTKPALRAFRKPEAGKDAEDGNGTCDFLGFPMTGRAHVGDAGCSNAGQPGNASGVPRRPCGAGVMRTVMPQCNTSIRCSV